MSFLDPETQSLKQVWHWWSDRLEMHTTLIRYGNYGVPMLLFPTAGGDPEELERQWLIRTLSPFILERRLKVYTVDSTAGRTWLTDSNVAHCVWVQKQYDAYIREEVVPAIHRDCQSQDIEIMLAGASIGAFNALASLCRHPDVFNHAICMSGTFDLEEWLQGQWIDEFHYLSPLHFIPGLPESAQLNLLRQRFAVIATGSGRYESPAESWRIGNALGQKGIPNRVDIWGPDWDHEWDTWIEMLPKYVHEALSFRGE